MNTHADKTQEDKSQSIANEVSQKRGGGESIFQFVDNPSEAVAQRKLQEVANNSPQAKQVAQLQAMADNYSTQQKSPIQKKKNNTGLPDNLKSGVEQLSGISMDDVKVHYNSDKPSQLQAHAYAQGTNIHLAPGQERHLPHEAWHVVQQKQGRVQPTKQLKSKTLFNDDEGLEKEADVMGTKALQLKPDNAHIPSTIGMAAAVTQLLSFGSEDEALIAFRKLIKGDDEGEHFHEAKEYLNYAQDRNWEDLEDEAIRYVRFHEDFDTDMALGQLEHDSGSESSLVVMAQNSLRGGEPTDDFKIQLSMEVGAKNGYKSEGMKYFAADVLTAFKSYLKHDPEKPEEAIHRAIWHKISDFMSDEEGYGSALPKYALGMQRKVIVVGGFILHFTNRTKESDVLQVAKMTHELVEKVSALDEKKLTELIIVNFREDTKKALQTIEATTKGTEHHESLDNIAKANRSDTVSEIRKYSAAVVNRWRQATHSGKIHIAFDRAKLKDAFGKSSAYAGATPQNMMSGDEDSMSVEQRITINLDAEQLDKIYITLAHEIAHAMGFNPTGMDSHGHFSDLDKYMEKEDESRTKLLFDAYYFETLVQHLY